MPLEFLISALVTLLVVVDPIGLVPTFLGITYGLPPKARLNVALRACLIAAAILAGSALIGDWLLRTLSISLPAFRIAGGLLLFSIASEMVFGVRLERQSREAEDAPAPSPPRCCWPAAAPATRRGSPSCSPSSPLC
jgi:multiple antibiotic resistance protein